MSDKGTEREPIEPALTAEEWLSRQASVDHGFVRLDGDAPVLETFDYRDGSTTGLYLEHDLAIVIALANAALPNEDPRKITHDDVFVLRQLPAFMRGLGMGNDPEGGARAVTALAAKLASYLPPRTRPL
jgi:hypothetical protein